MKRNWLIGMILGILLISGCTNDENDGVTIVEADGTEVQGVLKESSWVITSFVDDGKDETGNYSGYEFSFEAKGIATATNGSNTINGTWAMGGDNSTPKLILNFGEMSPFDELNEDWKLVSFESNKMSFTNSSGGDGSTTTLAFNKM